MKLGDKFPDFSCETDQGRIESIHNWIGDNQWGILFSHPLDYTPVCTTELGELARRTEEFKRRGAKLVAISCDSAESHRGWIKDIWSYLGEEKKAANGEPLPFPIIADPDRKLAERLEMLDPREIGPNGAPVTARNVFYIGPDKTIRTLLIYPPSCGRNFDELLRVFDSLLLTDSLPCFTPANWSPGQKVCIDPKLDTNKAGDTFGNHTTAKLPSSKEYLRFTSLSNA